MGESGIKAVIFDMDGVLFDTERISTLMWHKAAGEFGLADIETDIAQCRGCSKNDQIGYLNNKYGKDFLAEEFKERCSSLIQHYIEENGVPLLPYAREILSYLKNAGYRLSLASSTRTLHVYNELRQSCLIGYFETITCGDQVSKSKPDPEIYLTAVKSLSLEPKDCLAVEDSINGVKSALSASLKTVMVVDQMQPTDDIKNLLFKLCYSLSELKTFL